MRRTRITVVLFGLAFLFASAPARSQSSLTEPARLALEIHYYPGEPPAYQPVTTAARGAWFARFHRIKATGPNDLPVNAVDIKSILTPDGITVYVSVLFGELHEKQESVGKYTIHEGERVKIEGLTQYGIDPFTIVAILYSPSALDLP